MSNTSRPSIWELSDLCTPWCVHVAATLRLADHVARGKERVEELASACDCDAYALHRVMTHLARRGLFEEPTPGRFIMNDCARELLDPMARAGLDLEGFGGRMAHAWTTVLTYVRTGTARGYVERFGRSFWDDLDAHPQIAEQFDAIIGPAGHGTPDGNFDLTGGWEPVRHVIDVGGGTGAMLAEILRLRPHVRGTLVDLPRTVARAAPIFEAAGVANRATTVGQSFLDPLPRGADVYLLRGILNDWPDDEATVILQRCADAARPDGRVIVLKSVGPDGSPAPLVIEMILCGGKHRGASEFRKLAHDAGLEVIAAERQASGYFVVECRTT
jgi:2,7-dihydroxy-5-methyl-1-naphthoate 7-O-methyltransferase